MLGIGIGEMILIAGIALVIFGPEKFPDFAKIVLRTMRDLRGYVDDIQNEISKEIKPVKRELEQLARYDPEKYIDSLTKSSPGPTGAAVSSLGKDSPSGETDDGGKNERNDDSFDGAASSDSRRDDWNCSTVEGTTTEEKQEDNTVTNPETADAAQEGIAFEEPGDAPERLD